MLGFIIANIVGIQHYSGTINGRQNVGLVRDPLNRYDSNAIKVLNTRNAQVGNIERSVAAVLAPLVDDNLIKIEGIVPKKRGNFYKIPCQIHVFASGLEMDRVYNVIVEGGLQLIRSDEMGIGVSEAVVVKEGVVDDGKSLDEVFKGVGEVEVLEVMEAPREVVKSELFLHQKEGLGWLVKREREGELPPFWVEKNEGVFVNEVTKFETRQRPEAMCGGIFADDMGMGKTLTLLSLIALDKFSSVDSGGCSGSNAGSSVVDKGGEESNVFGGKNTKKRKGGKMVDNVKKKQKVKGGRKSEGLSVDNVVSRTTLVVCPPSVFSTWISQLEEHTKPGKLKVYLYYGDRTDDPMELTKYDLVLTTYSTLGSEDSSESPAFRVNWLRVILDEAHIIKNGNAQQTRAVNKLNAKRRWVVTGTPIQNGTLDLFSLMAFLRYQPFANKSYWNTLVQRPIDSGDKIGLSRLQVHKYYFWSTAATHVIIFYAHAAIYLFTILVFF